MASKADLFTATLYVGTTAITLLISLALGLKEIPAYMLDTEAIVLMSYPILWAFIMRRALAVPLYRQQAIGTSVLCVGLLLHVISHGGLIQVDVGAFTLALLVLFVFYLVDTSARAGRRSDPLRRDTLAWSKIRRPIWVIISILVILAMADMIATNTYSHLPDNPFAIGFVASILLVSGSGVTLLLLVSKRSGDRTLRRHLSWLGLAILATFATAFIGGVLGLFAGGGFAIGRAVTGYFLYKSSRSLAPLNRIEYESDSA